MSYYGGNIPPPEKTTPMYPAGVYPAGGTYLPTQSGLPPSAGQTGYPQMSQQYASMPTYTPTSAYASMQPAYPGTSTAVTQGAFHTIGFPSHPSVGSPSYVGSPGYPIQASGYPPGSLPPNAAYATGALPPSANPLYPGSAYGALHMTHPSGPGLGYPMPMYPASAYGSSMYLATSPYGGPPFP